MFGPLQYKGAGLGSSAVHGRGRLVLRGSVQWGMCSGVQAGDYLAHDDRMLAQYVGRCIQM